ncbi:hypothetical protein V5R04_05735 [Jonesiaceae bacterium BS-20]|uniref:Lipoprotein n=1 Tax=Jonesiaceae bacterium BS-20 TaxID=3120821 RepID=A0AAU7DYZ9_9MICO
MSRKLLAIPVVVLLALTTACNSRFTVDDIDFSTLSDFQREILDDGIVMHSEYESAMLHTRDCYGEAGFEVGAMEISKGLLSFEAEISYEGLADPEAADRKALAAIRQCDIEYSQIVGLVWTESLSG